MRVVDDDGDFVFGAGDDLKPSGHAVECLQAALDGVEAVEAGQEAGRQQQQQAFQIVARNLVCLLVAQGGGKLSRRQRAHHRTRDHHPRTEDAYQCQ